jgi:hypothetical protein
MGRWLPIWLRQPNWPGAHVPVHAPSHSSCVACGLHGSFRIPATPVMPICVWSDFVSFHRFRTTSPNMARETVAGARDVVSLAGH